MNIQIAAINEFEIQKEGRSGCNGDLTAFHYGKDVQGSVPYVLHLLLPTYNRVDILPATLDMIMGQDADPTLWHLTVVDNCSNDGTVELLQHYVDRYHNVDFTVNEYNLGLFGNLNRCMDLARTKRYMIVHSDDWVAPHLVSRALKVIDDFSDAGMMFGACRARIEETGEILEQWHSSSILGKKDRLMSHRALVSALLSSGSNFIFPPTVIYDRDLFTPDLRYSMNYRFASDFQLWLDTASRGPKIAYYSDPLITCSIHNGRLSHKNAKPMRLEYVSICRNFLHKLHANSDLHELDVQAIRLIKLKLFIFEMVIYLGLVPSFKTRRRVAAILEKIVTKLGKTVNISPSDVQRNV